MDRNNLHTTRDEANLLQFESSPYLLQHAHNPVNWMAWNDATLAKAKKENKMLLISVGYAACHWCHVMAHESFEDEEAAKIMNENYICIKVDREERPDVDQVYMDAAYLISGNGGWPLNALALPDGRPFFAGTYYPKENWIRLLEYFSELYKNERARLEAQAEQLSQGIAAIEKIPVKEVEFPFQQDDLEKMFANLESKIDWEHGGTKGAIKFPMPSVWEFLLHYHYFSGNAKALQAVEITLQNLANSGTYDQIGGGFSRYATDAQWHVPHFEKMLYDNAQLVSLYSHAYQLTKKPLYKKVVTGTLDFIQRELTAPTGGFYSSLDADSEGEEGKFYVWTADEIKSILKEDADLYFKHYGINQTGNWEHQKNIPDINFGTHSVDGNIVENGLNEKLISINQTLLIEREKRIRPGTDDKILTSWNALMAIGYIDAYRAFGDEAYFEAAKKIIHFLLENLGAKNHKLFRNFKNGKATIPAFLDDYAFFISALIQFYQISFDEMYINKAKSLADTVIEHFFDPVSNMFFYTDKDHSHLIVRKMETADNVIPASNSEMAKNLHFLSLFYDDKEAENKAIQMIKNLWENVVKNPGYYSNWAIAGLGQIHITKEIAITGNEWKSKLKALQKSYLPGSIFLGGDVEGELPLLKNKVVPNKTMIYICKNKTCGLPVEKVEDALKQIQILET